LLRAYAALDIAVCELEEWEDRMERFVFFFDGTGASAASRDQRETNVFRMNRAFKYGSKWSFYFSGVGTRRDFVSLASGAGLDEIIREAYVNLSSNYQPGDEIYIFGFSRGAVAARAFTGLISKSGLILCDGLEHYGSVWDYFVLDTTLRANDKKAAELREILDANALSGDERPRIKFLGLFDSVIGTYWSRLRGHFFETTFHSKKLDKSVDFGVQLLSIDDNRIPSFKPLLWTDTARSDHRFEQVWMPGVHGDVGGSSGATFLNNVALLTMIGCAQQHGSLNWDQDWDHDFINGVLAKLDRQPFEISSERSNVWNKILLSGTRAIGEVQCKAQSMHPIFEELVNQPVKLRGQWTRYEPKNVKSSLPTFYVPHFDDNLRTAAKHAVTLNQRLIPWARALW
jgi:Uncharacterized alpha/beta hydrolase domain (DUF2235)